MTEDTKLKLAFGRQTFPDDVKAVWGARLIWPNDLVFNRQDVQSSDDEAKTALVAWLNGPNMGDGALKAALTLLGDIDERYRIGLISQSDDKEVVIYEDDKGKVIGSAQSSHGYLYVCAWLK